jgi:hypothetical protein
MQDEKHCSSFGDEDLKALNRAAELYEGSDSGLSKTKMSMQRRCGNSSSNNYFRSTSIH